MGPVTLCGMNPRDCFYGIIYRRTLDMVSKEVILYNPRTMEVFSTFLRRGPNERELDVTYMVLSRLRALLEEVASIATVEATSTVLYNNGRTMPPWFYLKRCPCPQLLYLEYRPCKCTPYGTALHGNSWRWPLWCYLGIWEGTLWNYLIGRILECPGWCPQ